MTDEEFLAAFEKQAILRDDWSHEAHVRMTWLYCQQEPDFESMLDKVRHGIQALNAINGVEGKLYHETVTVAFSSIIYARATGARAARSWPVFRDGNRDLIDPGPSPLLSYYRKETLETDDARLGFIAPDLQPLPGDAAII